MSTIYGLPPFKRSSTQDSNGRDTMRDANGIPVAPWSAEVLIAELKSLGASEAELNTPHFIEAHAHTKNLVDLEWLPTMDDAINYLLSDTVRETVGGRKPGESGENDDA